MEVLVIRTHGYGFLFVVALVIGCVGLAYADQGVSGCTEIQGLSTVTSASIVGTTTETDAIAWTTNNDPLVLYTVTGPWTDLDPVAYAQLLGAGGSSVLVSGGDTPIGTFHIPESLLDQAIPGEGFGITWGDFVGKYAHSANTDPIITGPGLHTGALDPGQVQYTTAYDKDVQVIGGQTTFLSAMTTNTGNRVATQSNIDTKTSLQFIPTDVGGVATGSENILLDGCCDCDQFV